MPTCIAVRIFVAAAALASAPVCADAQVYWTEKLPGKVRRADLDGGNAQDVATGLSANTLTVTVAGTKVYWADGTAGKIERANLDGSGREDVATGLSSPRAVAVDLTGARIYWSVSGKIQRANLDGSAAEDLVALGSPLEVELDPMGGKIYWTDATNHAVRRANLADGSVIETLVTSPATSGPFGLDLDLGAGKLYWVSQGSGGPRQVQRANLDGSAVENLVVLTDPQGLALDLGSGKIYWTDQGTGKVQRANLDGSAVEDVAAGLDTPSGIDLALDDAGAGAVPDGQLVNGDPLMVDKTGASQVELDWTASCRATDTDYAVYQGSIGDYESHLPLLCSTGGATASSVVPLAKVYWTESIPGKVRRADLDGGNVQDVATGAGAIAVTVAWNKVYWANASAGKIERANLDGTGREDVATDLPLPRAVAVDLAAARLYWSVSGKIQRADLDGSNVQDLVTLGSPLEIELDPAGGKIYWTDSADSAVRRANLVDGSALETLVTSPLTFGPFGLDLDLGERKIYWVSQGSGGPRQVQRANFDGSGVENLVVLTDPQGLALDLSAGKIYWADQGTGRIQRASLDGSGVEDVAFGFSTPSGIDIAGAQNAYFLVTPLGEGAKREIVEGSYGQATAGLRPASVLACAPRLLASCP